MDLQTFDILVAKYLTDGLTYEEHLLLDHTIENDLFYFNRLEQMKSAWEQSNSFKVFDQVESNIHQEIEKFWERVEPDSSTKPFGKIIRLLKYQNIAAAVAFLLLVSSFVTLYLYVPGFGRWSAYSTKDHVEEVMLPDSTIVTLNSFSKIVYLKHPTQERKVRFKGEGYFRVAHNPSVPFVIDAGQTEVQVIGTKFNLNVNHLDKTSDILVTEGIVSFSCDGSHVILHKGESGYYRAGSIQKKNAYDDNRLFWRTGVLVYSNASLDEVANILMKNYNEIHSIKKTCSSTSVKITTRFENQSLEDIFKELELHFNKKFVLKNNILIISD